MQEEVENLLGISSKNSTDRTRKSQRTVLLLFTTA